MAALDIDAGAYFAALDKQLAAWNSGARLAVQATAYSTLHYAQRHVLVDTGRTRDSGRVAMRNSANVVSATISFKGVAVFIEYGTAPHEIRPKRGRVLKFQGRDGTVYTALVHHPGTRPAPFFRPAMLRAPGYYRGWAHIYMG